MAKLIEESGGWVDARRDSIVLLLILGAPNDVLRLPSRSYECADRRLSNHYDNICSFTGNSKLHDLLDSYNNPARFV